MPSTLAELRSGSLAGARHLDLSGAGLTEFPDEILGLADTLEILDLGRNAIAGLPPEFARLRRLRVLFCSGTPMRVLPPVLGDCAALEQVGFRGCGIETVPPDALPPRLRWLTLTDNRIASLPDALGTRPGLQKLMLAGNRLAALPGTLEGHAALELLRLSANRFEALPAFLADLPRLAWLAFGANPAEGAFPDLVPPQDADGMLLGALLGEGASGRVHAARWGDRDVAVKLFRAAVGSDGLPAHEIAAALAVGAHPNLLGALAVVEGRAGPALVMPLVPPGWQVLAAPPSLESCTRDVYAPGFALPPGAAMRIARDIAVGGAHLASRALLHGDLYAHNIHWNGTTGSAVLGDFGAASRRVPADRLEALDVLAWGILAGELLARAPADEANEALADAMRAATQPDPAARPGFADILDALATRPRAAQAPRQAKPRARPQGRTVRPSRRARRWQRRAGWTALLATPVLAALALLALFGRPDAPARYVFPPCASAAAAHDLAQSWNTAPGAHGRRLLGTRDAEGAAKPLRETCHADALLSDGTTRRLSFRYVIEDGRMFFRLD